MVERSQISRNEIYWADLGEPAGRRPVCVLTRSAALQVLTTVTVAPITRTIRGIASEVELGPSEGLPETCVINCDTLASIRQSSLDPEPIGVLGFSKRVALDRALRYSLDILA